MRFADIPGHQEIKRRLRAMADTGHIPHALLLEGPAGVGKFALARAFAQYIHCTDRTPDGDSCGRCPSCLQHQSFNNIDTFYTFPVVKRGTAGLSTDWLPEFRQFLTDSPFMDSDRWPSLLGNVNAQPLIYVEEASALVSRLNVAARQSAYKIVLLWQPERLGEATANKLLKLIEEPYSDTLFIMTSDNPEAILPTIYSRTQRISVRAYSPAEIVDILSSQFAIDRESATIAADLADGNVNAALRMVSVDKDKSRYLDLFMSLMRLAWTRKVKELRDWSNDVAAQGREDSIRFYDYCARMIRENFILNLGHADLNMLTDEELTFSRRFSPYINIYNVEDIFRLLTEARNDVARNTNGKIVAFDLAIKMILLIKRGVEAPK
ncbi:MAG: AAA family ATPase [Muribaculaceae bacterium]|nr:AAA family ATPase [Muribaculaceae bacterium]